jgi:hypothetical protein
LKDMSGAAVKRIERYSIFSIFSVLNFLMSANIFIQPYYPGTRFQGQFYKLYICRKLNQYC